TERAEGAERLEGGAVPVHHAGSDGARVHRERARLGELADLAEVARQERVAKPGMDARGLVEPGASVRAHGQGARHALARADGLASLGRDAHEDDERQMVCGGDRTRPEELFIAGAGLSRREFDEATEEAAGGARPAAPGEGAHARRAPVQAPRARGREPG